jgi:benzoate 4-monooxygenase
MAVLDFLFSPYSLPAAVFLFYVIPYFTSNSSIRDIPGPFAAKFSSLWLLLQARRGRRYLSVEHAHQKYGKLVRIQPNHVSIADASAIPIVYGHGNGFLKS